MRTALRRRSARGSTLLLVVILVGVLAAIGAAAVALSSRDRINASAKTRRDVMAACAQAAQAKIWAEIAKYGPRWLGSGNLVAEFTLADGTRLGPLHYDQAVGSLVVSDVTVALAAQIGQESAADLSNRSSGLLGAGHTYRCVARCTIPAGNLGGPDRQLEVEFQIRTSL